MVKGGGSFSILEDGSSGPNLKPLKLCLMKIRRPAGVSCGSVLFVVVLFV